MANCSRGRGRQIRVVASQPQAAPTGTTEPPVRRWPHPVDGIVTTQQTDPTLHYIRCALSYQNQLLADIKALLQQMASDGNDDTPET